MTLLIVIILFVLGGVLIAYSLTIFRSFTFRRFLGEFWGRFRQSHIFTILQLLGTALTWVAIGALSAGIVAYVLGGIFFSGFIGDSIYVFIGVVAGFVISFVISWTLLKRYLPNRRSPLPPLPTEPPTIIFETRNPDLIQEFKIFDAGFRAVYSCLHRNLQAPFGKIKTWFAIPGSKYPAAYLWDSCFISGAWRLWDTRIAQEILRPFLDLQDGEGKCPQAIALGKFPNYSITNPPLLAFAFMSAARMTGDYALPLHYLSRLQAFEKYLEDHRRSRGLFRWIHSYESGLDNSPRFTDASEKHKRDLQSLWAVDLNVWMILLYQAMAELVWHDNQDEKESTALQYEQKAQILLTGMLENLWHSKQGLFFDDDYEANQRVEVNTISSLLPLALPHLPDNVVDQLVKHVENPAEYNTPIPLPTVARDDPLFSKDTWRGPVWINTAWTVIFGLSQHGKNSLAGDLAYRLVKGVYETHTNCGSFYEFYDPDGPKLAHLNRKKGNAWKQITLGNKPINNFCGWTALINTLLLENVLGYARKEGKVSINPNLPKHWRAVTIHVKIPQFDEDFEIRVSDEGDITIVKEKNTANYRN